MFRQIQYSWQSYDPLYFSFPKHYFMSNVPVYPSEYLLMVLMLKTLLELTFIPLTLHFFQNKNLRKKKTTINLFTSQVLPSSQRCLLSLNFMQIKTSSKDPTDYANGLEKQELRQQVKKGCSLVTETPAPKRESPSGKGRGHAPTATPTPGLLHPPKLPWSGTKRRGGNAASTLLLQGDLGHASSVSSSGKWGQAFMAASTRAVGSGLSSPKFQGNYGPLPTRLPAVPRVVPPPRPRPRGLPAIWETNASATRDMAAARPWTRACAPRPSAPSRATSATPTQFTSLADSTLWHAETSSPDAAQPARLPPGRP